MNDSVVGFSKTIIISEMRIGRIVVQTQPGVGFRVSILCGNDLDHYHPTFEAVECSRGECWRRLAGETVRMSPDVACEWPLSIRSPLGIVTTAEERFTQNLQEAIEIAIPKLMGSWVKKFLKDGGDLSAGTGECWEREIVDRRVG